MTRLHVLPASLLLTMFLVVIPPEGWAGGGPKPRYQLPRDGRPGRVETEEYFKIDDPREAARLLLEESRLAGVDIDRVWESPPRHSVLLGSGSMTPDTNDKRFFMHSRSLVDEGHPDSAFVCVLKLGRNPTIREQATMMEMGVRFFVSIPHYAYIVRVTAQTAPRLEEMPVVEWMDELRPEQKYPPTKRFEADIAIMVYTLVGDMPECRADLERLGGQVLGIGSDGLYHHEWEYYGVQIDVAQVDDIASLWWVQMIKQLGRPDLELVIRGEGFANSPAAPAAFSASLKPRDSRRFVSYQKDSRYRGYGQVAFVYEVGCDWNHSGLGPNALTSSSPPNIGASADILHGTMVAGIVAGVENSSVLGGGVSGVAPGARFQYTAFTGTPLAVETAASSGLWLQNHSWGLFAGAYADSLGVYTEEARLFDRLAGQHDILFNKSAGNQGTNPQYGPAAITSPGTGKNVIAVGAVKYITEAQDTLGQLASYSSQGPTRDNIPKPELVAPGGNDIVVGCGERGVVSCGTSNARPCQVWDSGYRYAADAGTSFAAPHVTGAAAVVAEAYQKWYELEHNEDPDYAPSALLTRALLINTAVPLRWNGTSHGRLGGSLVDTLVTAELLFGLANEKYGYGLVNCYSGVHSSDSEYRRMLVAQDALVGVADHKEYDLSLRIKDNNGQLMRPRYLLVTMAYNDLPGAGMVDRLKLSLVDPLLGRMYVYQPPSGIAAGTVQKIIVPWPSHVGQWQIKVTFEGTSSPRPFPEQQFVLVADVMFQAPALALIGLKSESDPYEVRTGQTHGLNAVVENIAGNVAAGVTVRIEDPFNQLPPSAEFGKDYYVGNLVRRGDRQSRTFLLGPFAAPGEYSVDVVVNCVNKLLGGGPYPLKKRVKIRVLDFRQVRGEVVMLPGYDATVKDASILVNGVPSGKKTDENGLYSVEVPKGFSGVISPRKGTSVFIPDKRDYERTPILGDTPDQDYKAEFRRINGRILDERGVGVDSIIITTQAAPGISHRASASVQTLL